MGIKPIPGQDTYAALSLAFHFSQGHFSALLNGLWSPLFMLELIPFSRILEADYAIGVLNFLNGFLAFWAWLRIVKPLNFNFFERVSLFFSGGVSILVFSLTTATADVLCLWLVLEFLKSQSAEDASPWTFGLWAVLLFFAKAYLLFFVFLIGIFQFISRPAEKFKFFTKAIIIPFSVLLFWGFLLQAKYGYFTISYTASYNHALSKLPEAHGWWMDNGLLSLPSSYSFFAWEDILLSKKWQDWSPFSSSENFLFQAAILKNNLIRFLFLGGIWFSPLLIVSLFVFFYKDKRALFKSSRYFFWAAFLFPLGYLFFFFEDRHIYPGWLLLFTGTMISLSKFQETWNPRLTRLSFFVCSFSFLAFPIYSLRSHEKQRTALPKQSFSCLKWNEGLRFASWRYDAFSIAWEKKAHYFGGLYGEKNVEESIKKFSVEKILIKKSQIPEFNPPQHFFQTQTCGEWIIFEKKAN